jgi:hypothetical protein
VPMPVWKCTNLSAKRSIPKLAVVEFFCGGTRSILNIQAVSILTWNYIVASPSYSLYPQRERPFDLV